MRLGKLTLATGGALVLLSLTAPAAHAVTVIKETVKYTAEYTRTGPAGNSTTWNCAGTWKLASTGAASETEICVVGGATTGITAGTYTGAPSGPMPGLAGLVDYAGNLIDAGTDFAWFSDYSGVQATSWTITVARIGRTGAFKFRVAADYAANPPTETLTINDNTPGLPEQVDGVPGSITCNGGICTYTFDQGTVVSMSYTSADVNSVGLGNWSGCDSQADFTACTVTMSTAKTVNIAGNGT